MVHATTMREQQLNVNSLNSFNSVQLAQLMTGQRTAHADSARLQNSLVLSEKSMLGRTSPFGRTSPELFIDPRQREMSFTSKLELMVKGGTKEIEAIPEWSRENSNARLHKKSSNVIQGGKASLPA